MPVVFWQIADPGYYEGQALHPEVRYVGPNEQRPQHQMTKDSWNWIY